VFTSPSLKVEAQEEAGLVPRVLVSPLRNVIKKAFFPFSRMHVNSRPGGQLLPYGMLLCRGADDFWFHEGTGVGYLGPSRLYERQVGFPSLFERGTQVFFACHVGGFLLGTDFFRWDGPGLL